MYFWIKSWSAQSVQLVFSERPSQILESPPFTNDERSVQKKSALVLEVACLHFQRVSAFVQCCERAVLVKSSHAFLSVQSSFSSYFKMMSAISTKDYAVGDLIFSEMPCVKVVAKDAKSEYCDNCLCQRFAEFLLWLSIANLLSVVLSPLYQQNCHTEEVHGLHEHALLF